MTFLAMINDLSTTGNSLKIWKFADGTTLSEVIYKNIYSVCQLQNKVEVLSWSKENRFRLNPTVNAKNFSKHEHKRRAWGGG